MKRHTAVVTALAIFILFAGLIFYLAVNTQGMKNTKIADFSHDRLHASFSCPRGLFFEFVIAFPTDSAISKNTVFTIKLSGSDGRAEHLVIAFNDLEKCNWLQSDKSITSYILTWEVTRHRKLLLFPNRDYNLSIVASSPLPDRSSLWLCCLQNYFERSKAEQGAAANP